ncbi:hypothetical protein GCM10010123_20210 [Pilimelia anulata]|uniref:SIR2-like domain-containing protein n=1 Tax=Pilimelia anulata TaxID=53371 RepID=A0A8J3B9N9_9ACTN|nr:SIR2 family protein [Pilimelia anulata]GGJ90328.1 hypothetical protein GCM10010123_20210 [Pilimelia anulata]
MRTALIGNGLSVAHNQDLSSSKLFEELKSRFSSVSAPDTTEAAFKKLATSLDPGTGYDLENLIGPLDILDGAMSALEDLTALTDGLGPSLSDSVAETRAVTKQLYRHGVSHVLELIAERSLGHGTDHAKALCARVAQLGDAWCLATLNYDGILVSAALEVLKGNIADLADGRPAAEFKIDVVPGGPIITGNRLRTVADLPCIYSVVNLHGSLGWLRSGSDHVKFQIDALRGAGYWSAWREDRTQWAPSVILTNQAAKGRLIREYPFRFAYSYFFDRLVESKHWYIIGYGFGDRVLNEVLRRVARTAFPSARKCYVVTKEGSPDPAMILDVLGVDLMRNTTICDHGMPAAIDCVHSPGHFT